MKPTDLRAILQYIPRFREKTFVISIDGEIVTGDNFTNILLDIAVLRSLNIRLLLVHGAAAQIQRLAREQGVEPSDLDGTGVTDDTTLRISLIAANRLTHEILQGLSANDLRAAYTNAVTASPVGILQGKDHLFTGKVERVDVELLQTLLGQQIIPVIAPLGIDNDGKSYRINSDAVALAVASALRAVKIIFITTRDGLIRQGQLIRQISVSNLDHLLVHHKHELMPHGLSKAMHAAAACKAGIHRVHVINGHVDEALIAEIFSNEGIGTLVYANEYQQIRPAMKKDVRTILSLTRGSVETDELIKRTRTAIERQLSDYYIFEIDRNPVGCVALHVYPESKKGELACLYVRSSHENQGIGRKLMSFVEDKARELGLEELITLSTQTFSYFQSKAGFTEGNREDLPPGRREKWDQSGRKSKVLVKHLDRPALLTSGQRA